MRVFVDGVGVEAVEGSSALDAVRLLEPARADEVAAGTRVITDSRGLPIPNDTPVFAGAIFRVVRARAAGDAREA